MTVEQAKEMMRHSIPTSNAGKNKYEILLYGFIRVRYKQSRSFYENIFGLEVCQIMDEISCSPAVWLYSRISIGLLAYPKKKFIKSQTMLKSSLRNVILMAFCKS